MKTLTTFFALITLHLLSAQTTISGVVMDTKNQPIEGANVYIDGSYDGSTTQTDGIFSFETSTVGIQKLVISFMSFETKEISKEVSEMKQMTVKLKEAINSLDAVILTAGNFKAGDASKASVLKPLDIVTTAGAVGDIIGALATLPGVQTVGEDGRLFIRGGDASESQTFIDGSRVPQPYGATLGNLPTRSRFSPFLFKGISFSTGAYSAEYGNALSGILELNTQDEPAQNQTDISLMTVGLGVGNSQKWEKSSLTFNVAYVNLAPYQALVPQNVSWNKPFQSLGGEMVYRHKLKNGLLKIYTALDGSQLDINQEDINFNELQPVNLSNTNLYQNVFMKQYFDNHWTWQAGASFGVSNNKIEIPSNEIKNTELATHLKSKMTKKFNNRFQTSFGVDFFNTNFDESINNLDNGTFKSGYNENVWAFYSETDLTLSNNFALKIGGRVSHNPLLSETNFAPRISAAFKLNENSQLSTAFGHFYQSPNADYLKYTTDLETQFATHYIANYQWQNEGKLFRVEAFRKEYDQLTKFDTETPFWNSNFTSNGQGFAQGLDVFYRDNKSIKNLEYWVSYSFIDSKRDFRNYTAEVAPSFVAKHTASLVGKYWVDALKSQIGFSYTWNSGRPFNNPNQETFMASKTKSFNNMSMNWAYLITQQKILYFSVSNITNADNVFGYQYANQANANGVFENRAVRQPANQFFFIGFFWTISKDKKTNQLNNL
uniref:TonB-dependent receptor n=1 Tax=Flavobacterium sp. TaxID=239 RepID=UPI00404A6C9F